MRQPIALETGKFPAVLPESQTEKRFLACCVFRTTLKQGKLGEILQSIFKSLAVLQAVISVTGHVMLTMHLLGS